MTLSNGAGRPPVLRAACLGRQGYDMEPVLHHLAVPGPLATHGEPRRIAWWEWGSEAAAPKGPAQVVLCVHGLTRQARDFDVLAQALLAQAQRPLRVLCVDVAGRGHSDWLADPAAYGVPTYAADLALLLAHLRANHAAATGSAEPAELAIDWVGTSMGGLIGMALAAQPGLGLRRLVLNDVGPVIEAAALRRIATYVGTQGVYASEQDAVQALAQLVGRAPRDLGLPRLVRALLLRAVYRRHHERAEHGRGRVPPPPARHHAQPDPDRHHRRRDTLRRKTKRNARR